MTDQPDQPQQSDQQSDADAAYEAALAGETGRDKYGLPARKVTTVGNESVDAAEQRARAELEAIEKLKGDSTEATEQPTEQQQPEQPAPEEPAEVEGALAPEQVVDFLLGEPEPELTPEEAAAAEARRVEEELVSGEAARAATKASEQYQAAIDKLIADSPGIQTEACIDAMTEPWERVAAAYGEEVASSPDIVRQIYEQTGGEQRWAAVAQANAEADAYRQALGGKPRDAFGFPIEE